MAGFSGVEIVSVGALEAGVAKLLQKEQQKIALGSRSK